MLPSFDAVTHLYFTDYIPIKYPEGVPSTTPRIPPPPETRGSIPAKVGFWVGLRIFSYVSTPTKLTNAISKTQLSGPKKGVFLPKIPRKCPFFVFGGFSRF